MIYLENFRFPDDERESCYFHQFTPTYYISIYPFKFLSSKGLKEINFSEITIFAGSNGCGKSTVLNIIAEKLLLKRESSFNCSELFNDYVNDYTSFQINEIEPEQLRQTKNISRIITSDDVFNNIFKVRKTNEDIDFKRDLLGEKRMKIEPPAGFINCEDSTSLKAHIKAYQEYDYMTKHSLSDCVRKYNLQSERTFSNGENGFKYFTNAIQSNGLYLLDEPENSLSASLQIELAQFIGIMARFYNCQFIISSHSPFLLSMPFAKIYNMDANPVSTIKWTDIPNIRIYHDFFEKHRNEFE